MYNSLKYTQRLEDSGFTRKQAEETVNLVVNTMNEQNIKFHSEMRTIELQLDSKIELLRNEMNHGFHQLEYRMTLKLGAIVLGVIVVLKFLR